MTITVDSRIPLCPGFTLARYVDTNSAYTALVVEQDRVFGAHTMEHITKEQADRVLSLIYREYPELR